jgi:hypothetical protein
MHALSALLVVVCGLSSGTAFAPSPSIGDRIAALGTRPAVNASGNTDPYAAAARIAETMTAAASFGVPMVKTTAQQPGPAGDPISVILVSGDLPGRALAVVQVRPHGARRTFIAMSENHMNDLLILRAYNVMKSYARHHPEDQGHVEFRLMPDGSMEIQSDVRGTELGSHVPVAEQSSGRNGMTTELLQHAATVPETEVAGFGQARVIDLPGMQQR